MKRVSWCVVGAVLAVGVGCGGNNQTRDAGSAGGTAFTGGGSSGVGGGSSATGGGSVTGGGRTGGGSATGGGAAGGSAIGGGSVVGGGTGGSGGGSTEFDGGGLMGGESCTNAVAVAGNTISVTSTTMGLGSDYAFTSADMGCQNVSTGSMAPDVVYAVPVAAGEAISASVTTTWDAVINLVVAPASNCGDALDGGSAGAVTCVAGADDATAGTDTAQWRNQTGGPVTVFVVVDGYDDGEEGDFSLNISVGPPPAGDVCADATALTATNGAISVTGATLTGFSNDYDSSATGECAFGGGPDRVYAITIPPNQRLTGFGTSTVDLALSVIDDMASCSAQPEVCSSVAFNDPSFGDDDTTPILAENTTAAARTVYLVVDSLPGSPPTFSLDLKVGPIPAGDNCTSATAVTTADAGTTLATEDLTGFVNDYGSSMGCEFGSGPDRVYAATVPANARLVVRATSGSNLSLQAVADVAACGAATVTCLSAVDQALSGASQVETLFVDNATAMAKPVLIIVDSLSTSPMGTFSLEFSTGSIPPGESCAMPIALTPVDGGVNLPGETLVGFASDFTNDFATTMGCAFGGGSDRAYTVPVASGQRLQASASSLGDLGVSVITSTATCAARPLVCVARADNGGSSTMTPVTESVRYDNTSGAAQNVVVVVDSFGAPQSYDLSMRVAPIPPPAYTSSLMSGACDSFASVTPTPLLTDATTPVLSDDVASALSPLPFAFSFFGTPVTHYAVSSNGFLQVFPTAMGTSSSSAANSPIPTVSTPNGLIAPFWDDLNVMGTSSRVVSNVFGTGTARHLTVQWEQMMVFGVAGSSITVQARLYETTNVIELHACSLTPGTNMSDMDRERGLEATVGVESVDGLDGVQHSHNQANVTAGQVIRYTP